MKIFFRFFRDYPRESVLAPLFKLLEACFDLLVPLVVASMIDRGITGQDTAHIFSMTGVLVLLAFVGLACAVTAQYFAARAAVGTAAKLRHELFAHMQSFTYAETDRVGVPTMITRMTSDVNQVQSGVNMALRLTLRSPVIVFGAMIMAFTVDVKLALIFVCTIPLLAAVVFGVMLGGIPLYKRVQAKLDAVTGRTRENLAGVRVIRAFRREDDEIKAFDEVNDEQTALQNRAGRLSSVMNPLTYVLVNLAVVCILWMGAPAVRTERLTQGEVVALVNYMGQILVELVKLANTIFLITKAVACSTRIGAVLDMPAGLSVTPDDGSTPEASADTPAVSFENVSLCYHSGSAPALSDISFTVPRGATVGIIGGTGSGKTSLVNLIPRFYEATQGKVCVFGREVSSYDPAALRARIGVVPQKADLFRGTVRSNLLWGSQDGQADDETLWQALEIAQAADFIRDKQGLDTPVEQKGRNFSGGQKQRLTIARALVGHPDVLILDDSASALDYATDAALRKALRSLTGTTVLLISQRTASIRACDSILVLDEGRAVGIGTHDELLASCPLYREIHESQYKGGDAV